METSFNPILLKLVRLALGKSQKDFAMRLAVKQAVLSKYENGIVSPSEAVLAKLTQCTPYPQDFFFQAATELPSGLVFHRKRNSLPASLRERIESEVRLRSMDVIAVCKDADVCSDTLERGGRSAIDMAQALRKAWHLDDKPIGNLMALLEEHHIVILKFDFGTDKLDAFFMPLPNGIICIALNANEAFSADRQNFSLAHELGHALLHKEQVQDDTLEKEADAFAAEFLFPQAAAKEEYTSDFTFLRLKELKAKWQISMQAILFRWHKLNLLESRLYRRYYIYFSSQGYRKHEPPCGVEHQSPSLLLRLMHRFLNRHQQFLQDLHLTHACFMARYPTLDLPGGALMAP